MFWWTLKVLGFVLLVILDWERPLFNEFDLLRVIPLIFWKEDFYNYSTFFCFLCSNVSIYSYVNLFITAVQEEEWANIFSDILILLMFMRHKLNIRFCSFFYVLAFFFINCFNNFYFLSLIPFQPMRIFFKNFLLNSFSAWHSRF